MASGLRATANLGQVTAAAEAASLPKARSLAPRERSGRRPLVELRHCESAGHLVRAADLGQHGILDLTVAGGLALAAD